MIWGLRTALPVDQGEYFPSDHVQVKEIEPCYPGDSESVISQNSGICGYDVLSVGELFWVLQRH
jgi:hypothetical protein